MRLAVLSDRLVEKNSWFGHDFGDGPAIVPTSLVLDMPSVLRGGVSLLRPVVRSASSTGFRARAPPFLV